MNDILFLGSRGRGMNLDMIVLKNYLVTVPDASLYFFARTEIKEIPEEKQAVLLNKQTALDHCGNVICADASLKSVKLEDKEQVRVIIPGMYEYVFREALAEKKKEQKALDRFTHIVATSPFAEEMFQQMYTDKEITFIKGIPSPAMWDICRESSREQMNEVFYKYCPSSKGKKVLLLYSSNKEAKIENAFADFDLKKLLDTIDDDWVVCTNIAEIHELAGRLPGIYQKKYIFIPNGMWIVPAIYSADFLVTNNSYYGSVFAARKQPLYFMPYAENRFEKFMKKFYPDQFLADLNSLAEEWEGRDSFAKKNKAFFERFTYDCDTEPIPEIISLLR